MTDKEAIYILKNYIECLMEDYGYYKDIIEFRDSIEYLEKSLQTKQSELEKKDKQIEEKTNRIKNLEIECQKHFDNMMDTIQDNHKKDNIIDLMSEQLSGLTILDKEEPLILGNKEDVKQYFEKKVEGIEYGNTRI